MNAIEIRNLTKKFKDNHAVSGLNMTVPQGAIYGFIGENGSGKSTTEKMISGLLIPSGGSIKLFDKDYTDQEVRSKIGVLIEAPGCFANMTVWDNMLCQAYKLGIPDAKKEVKSLLRLVRMEGSAGNKYKNCSLGMKQRVGIAIALLGKPKLLVLDEPINGLDSDGCRIVREILIDITKNYGCTVLISSHILGELEKIATHYGIIRKGKMICETTAEKLDENCPRYVSLKTKEIEKAKELLKRKYSRVEIDDEGFLRVYDEKHAENVASYLHERGVTLSLLKTMKISLEEYYIELMNEEKKSW